MISFTSRVALKFKRGKDNSPLLHVWESSWAPENPFDLPEVALPRLQTQAPASHASLLVSLLGLLVRTILSARKGGSLPFARETGSKRHIYWPESFSQSRSISWLCSPPKGQRSNWDCQGNDRLPPQESSFYAVLPGFWALGQGYVIFVPYSGIWAIT
jgi:hypothetical protein